jgi:hypothetical protein
MTLNIKKKKARVRVPNMTRGIETSGSGYKRKCGKRDVKKDKNMNCFNYGKPSHFARDCTEPKVMFNHNHPSNIYVSNCLMLA